MIDCVLKSNYVELRSETRHNKTSHARKKPRSKNLSGVRKTRENVNGEHEMGNCCNKELEEFKGNSSRVVVTTRTTAW